MDADKMKRIDAAAEACDRHRKNCRECFMPIIDDEGNPGLFGEACHDGLVLLAEYVEELGDAVPAWVIDVLEPERPVCDECRANGPCAKCGCKDEVIGGA